MTDALGHHTTWTYDDAGLLKTVQDPNGNVTTYGYDSVGRLATETLPSTGSGIATITYGYNANDQLTSVTDPNGHTTTTLYDSLGRATTVTDALNHSTVYGYDANSNPTTVTDPLGHVTTSVYDARNRLISVTEPSGGGTTTYTYDDASRLTSVTDSVGNVTGYAYDAQGRLIDEVDPRSLFTTYVYDATDNLTSTTDRLGRTTTYTYDADNRETTEMWLLPGGSSSYLLQIFRDYGGRVTGVADNFSQYNYLYDNADRLTSVSDLTATGMPHVTFTYSYDNNGNRTSMADSLGGVTSYTYDARDELTKITQSGTGVANKRVDFLYDPAGRLTTLTRYSDLSGTSTVLVSKYAYDVADRLTTLTNQTSGGTVRSSYVYGYDNADRLTSETRTWGSGSTDTLGYSYTNNDQLTGVTHTNGSFANETFGYDANGNRNTTGYTTGAANQTTSDGTYTYTYDAEGNLTAKTNISTGNQTLYVWDARNRLVEVDQVVSGVQTTLAQYTYDVFNNPIKVVEGGSTRYTLYDGQTPVLDFDASSTLTARYLNGPAIDEVLARETTGGTVAWYITDRLGTVRDLVNNTGAVIDHVDYSVYGTVLSESAPSTGDRFKYAGMELDSTTGLYYDRARWYDSAGGKFVGQDPIGFAGRDNNLYRYVWNLPLVATDPQGTVGKPNVPHDGPVDFDTKANRLHGLIPPLEYINPDTSCADLIKWMEATRTSIQTRLTNRDTFGTEENHEARIDQELQFLRDLFTVWYTRNCGGRGGNNPFKGRPIQPPSGIAAMQGELPAIGRNERRNRNFYKKSILLPEEATDPNGGLGSMRGTNGPPLPYRRPPREDWKLELDYVLSPFMDTSPGQPTLVPLAGAGGSRPPGGGPGRNPAFPGRTTPLRPAVPVRVPAGGR